MKSLIFAECLAALKANNFEFVESRIKDIDGAPMEPAAAALYASIYDQLAIRRADLARHLSAASVNATESGTARRLVGHDGDQVGRSSVPVAELLPPQAAKGRIPGDAVTPIGDDTAGILISEFDKASPLPGISIVAGCMNREENMMKVLDSWLATDAAEIVIVDWSSEEELWPKLSGIGDKRLKVIRIDGEKHWVLTHALNAGLRFAAHEVVLKVDCDIRLHPDFLKESLPKRGEFVRGFWRTGLEIGGQGQKYINGTFIAHKTDLRAANYYDERILTYGWDDSDLYLRLTHELGLAARQIDPRFLRHLDQAEESRVRSQKVLRNRFLERYELTEFEGAKNKFYTMIAGTWGRYSGIQDYRISRLEPNIYRGIRTTVVPPHIVEIQRLAETLAISHLTLWAASDMPGIGKFYDYETGIAHSSLLRDAHEQDKSLALINGIAKSSDVYFISCEAGPCRNALGKTLEVLAGHYPAFSQRVVLIEDELITGSGKAKRFQERILTASGELIGKLAVRAGAQTLLDVGELESRLEHDDRGAVFLEISIRSLAAEAMRKASRFSTDLTGEYELTATPFSNSCLVTSLYDELNLIRLIEYVACVIENLGVFERVELFYERSTGILAAILQEISQRLAIRPGRISLHPYQKRPTFEELFSIKSLLPEGRILAVANADVVFDASFGKLTACDLSRKVVVLSRRDISRDGHKASLIRLENGTPNTFSADAWIVSTPFEPDFFLDYPIGTMHCDSFINYQVSKSRRYTVINPCLDVRLYHLHDDRFNSSAQKKRRDFEEIQKRYDTERARNNDIDPINGVAWSTLVTSAIVPATLQMQVWKPKALVINLTTCSTPTFGHFLVIHLLYEALRLIQDAVLVVRMPREVSAGPFGTLLARYQAHFKCASFLIDVQDGGFDGGAPAQDGTIIRRLEFDTVVDWIVNGTRKSQHNNTWELLVWPAVKDVKLLCCEVSGRITANRAGALFSSLEIHETNLTASLLDFFKKLPFHSEERRLVTPYIAPYLHPIADLYSAVRTKSRPRVSFITSLFRGGDFLPGFLTNVLTAARKAHGEVIIVDANVDELDARVVMDFLAAEQDAKEFIQYVRIEHDPGLYACWRLAIERSRAEYVTNANIDDRRCPFHTSRLVAFLESRPEFAGACGSISCVTGDGRGDWFKLYENKIWFYDEGIKEIGFGDLYRTNDQGEVRSRNVLHCMPVWRRRLHEKFGYFDEEAYGTSADWAFWLKCTKAGEKFGFDKGAFGQYFMNPKSHNRRNDPEGLKERKIIEDFIGVAQGGFIKQ